MSVGSKYPKNVEFVFENKSTACGVGEAIKGLWYPPLVKEVTQRCKVMAAFHRDELSKLAGSAGDPFNGIAVDLNALGALGLCTVLHCCLAFGESVHNQKGYVWDTFFLTAFFTYSNTSLIRTGRAVGICPNYEKSEITV